MTEKHPVTCPACEHCFQMIRSGVALAVTCPMCKACWSEVPRGGASWICPATQARCERPDCVGSMCCLVGRVPPPRAGVGEIDIARLNARGVADPAGAELAAALRAAGCTCERPPAGPAYWPHEQTCPLWAEPAPAPPAGAREWLAALLQWSARVGPLGTDRAEAAIGHLCSQTSLDETEQLALFRELRACELHVAFSGGCVHCRANVQRRLDARKERTAERTGIKDCERCGGQLARVAGPGSVRGWHCFSCDPPFDLDD